MTTGPDRSLPISARRPISARDGSHPAAWFTPGFRDENNQIAESFGMDAVSTASNSDGASALREPSWK